MLGNDCMTFDPFESRLCRDIRNKTGHSFVKSVRQTNPDFLLETAAAFEEKELTESCVSYICGRQTHLREILKSIKETWPSAHPDAHGFRPNDDQRLRQLRKS